MQAGANPGGNVFTYGVEPEQRNKNKQQARYQPVIKLYGGNIFKEIFPQGLEGKNTFGDESSVHEWEGIEGITGLESCDKATRKHHDKYEQGQ